MTQTRNLIKPIKRYIKQSCKKKNKNQHLLIKQPGNILNIFHEKVGISISLIAKQKIARIINKLNHKHDKFDDEFERSELYNSEG